LNRFRAELWKTRQQKAIANGRIAKFFQRVKDT
jgi:hypothetical protein